MSNHIEKLMINSAHERENGWIRLNSEKMGKEFSYNHHHFRTITIGSPSNCNDDRLICAKTTSAPIKDVMKKYNIIDYKVIDIHTETMFASQLIIGEEIYDDFIARIN